MITEQDIAHLRRQLRRRGTTVTDAQLLEVLQGDAGLCRDLIEHGPDAHFLKRLLPRLGVTGSTDGNLL